MISESAYFANVRPQIDFVVLPEDVGERGFEYPGRRIIFNKNIFHGWTDYAPAQDIYLAASTEAALAVSEHNRRHLALAYPHLPIYRVDVEIDPTVFQFRPLSDKRKIVVCSSKAAEMMHPLLRMVHARAAAGLNAARCFDWVFLEGRSEREAATLLGEAAMLLSCNVAEGLGRTTLEAMACGCIVLGSGSGPLEGRIASPCSFLYGNLLEAVGAVEQSLAALSSDLGRLQEYADANLVTAKSWSPENQANTVLRAWDEIMGRKSGWA